ncbi:MAG TPA: ABC transporter permease [Vicinamibacteria bacterium]|nr:ABC transporter permease [Vicinamibacteria bacterium]
MEGLLLDIRHAMRLFARRPAVSILVVATLAFGIGTATTMFTVLADVVLRPLDFRAPDELVFVTESNADGSQIYSVSIPNFRDWRERNRSFESLSAFRAQSFNLRSDSGPLRARGGMVSDDFFDTLGVAPAVGSGLPGGEDAIVLASAFATERFGSAERAIGHTLYLNDRPFAVAGVMPKAFEFLTRTIDFWIPMQSFRDELPWDERGDHPALWVVGRLLPGVSLAQAKDDMARISQEIDREHDHPHPAVLSPLHERSVGRARPALVALGGSVLLLLLIAWVNVANLLLVQASGRTREMATRAALGASGVRLLRQLGVESLVLSVLGGVLGALGASWGVDLVRALMPTNTPRIDAISFGAEDLVFALAVCLLSGLLFGLAPLFDARQTRLQRSSGSSRALVSSRRRLAQALVVSEVSLSVILLLATGLLVKTFLRIFDIAPGFRTEGRLAARVTLPASDFAEPSRAAGFYRDVLAELRANPGLESVAVSTGLPLVSTGVEAGVLPSGGDPEEDEILASIQIVSAGYFPTMGIRLLRGRILDARDTDSSPRVAVVDEMLERALFPGRSALGERISIGGTVEEPRLAEIVGIVEHVLNYQLTSPQYPEVYLPLEQPPEFGAGIREGNLIVRYTGSEAAAVAAVGEAIQRINPAQPIYGIMTFPEIVGLARGPFRTNGILSAAFALSALSLSGIGLYGVLAGVVSRRSREIGLRMALGATPGRILGSVFHEGMLLVAIGAAVGLSSSLVLGRFLSSILYQASSFDVDVIASTVGMVILVSAVACGLPARRASSTEPVRVLADD